MSREAMQQALETLERIAVLVPKDDPQASVAITALRQALETEHQPVAWADMAVRGEGKGLSWTPGHFHKTPLYTAPQKRKWVGLTDQEIDDLWNQHERRFDFYSFSCDIEAKLKEKNS